MFSAEVGGPGRKAITPLLLQIARLMKDYQSNSLTWPYSMRTAVVLLIIFPHEGGPALELGPRGDVGSLCSEIFRLALCLLWCCISSGSKSSYQTGHGIETSP